MIPTIIENITRKLSGIPSTKSNCAMKRRLVSIDIKPDLVIIPVTFDDSPLVIGKNIGSNTM